MKLAVAVGLFVSSALAACADPGCIRNTECGTEYRCIEAACVRVDDAGFREGDDDAGSE